MSLGGGLLLVLVVVAALRFIFVIEDWSNRAFNDRMRQHFGDDWDR